MELLPVAFPTAYPYKRPLGFRAGQQKKARRDRSRDGLAFIGARYRRGLPLIVPVVVVTVTFTPTEPP